MTTPSETNQVQATPSDKELNFRKLEERFERLLQEERQKVIKAEEEAKRLASLVSTDDDEEDSEPYVDRKKLKKELTQFASKTRQDTQSAIQSAVQEALSKERQQNWMKQNPDFYEVMQHADRFAQQDPEWAEEFLNLPEGFERQKLVYKSIKAMGLHKKEEPKPTIQDELKNNRKGLYYNPTGVGSAPYQGYSVGKDYSTSEQQTAYQKMQELKNRLRLG